MILSPTPENGLLTVHKTRYDKHDLHSPAGENHQLHPTPPPISSLKLHHSSPCPTKERCCTPFILRRAELSRKNGWADEYGRIYLYYPICKVVALLHCGRQKAVNTLRELQYAGLVEIQKQGCGKPNRIYPKSYEAVPTADFKKSGCGMPEG